MYLKTQAEVFIQTLAVLLDEDREFRKSRLRVQHKERAERFVQAIGAKLVESRRSAERTSHAGLKVPETARHVRND